MVPIVMNASELKLIAYGKKIEGANYKGIVDIEEELRASLKAKTVDYKIGTMIELPAAALGAGEIARYGAFFSFGTNDLTQMTLGISRDDINTFLPDYLQQHIFDVDPFASIDETGVGELMQIAVERGREVKPDLSIGICGEHGGDPATIDFCYRAGLSYVSCSPFRVPLARLASAQAVIRSDTEAPKKAAASAKKTAAKKPAVSAKKPAAAKKAAGAKPKTATAAKTVAAKKAAAPAKKTAAKKPAAAKKAAGAKPKTATAKKTPVAKKVPAKATGTAKTAGAAKKPGRPPKK